MTVELAYPQVRRLWLAGLCICCGGELRGWDHPYRDGHYEPSAVAGGAYLCGRCTGNRHLEDFPELKAALLRTLAAAGGSRPCGISWYHTDHSWTDSDGTSYRCPGVWPHDPKPQK